MFLGRENNKLSVIFQWTEHNNRYRFTRIYTHNGKWIVFGGKPFHFHTFAVVLCVRKLITGFAARGLGNAILGCARARKTRQMFRGSGKANTSLLFIVNASNFRFSVDANCRHPTQSFAFIYTKSLFPAKTAERKLRWVEWKVFTILPRATGDDSRPAISESSLRDRQQCLKKNVSNTRIEPCLSCQYVRRSLFFWA